MSFLKKYCENFSEIVKLETTPSELDQRIKDEFWEFCRILVKGVLEIFLAWLFALITRDILINETTSYNDDSSFPFKNLTILILGNFSVSVGIRYKHGEYNSTKTLHNQPRIEINSILNVSDLILEKEFEDALEIYFRINDDLTKIEDKNGIIVIYNKIYFLNTSNYEIKDFYRLKKFFIEDEIYSIEPKNEFKSFKRYDYFVHARSIESLEETKNFAIIDENEKFRIIHEKGFPAHFAVRLTKRKFISRVKVIKEGLREKFEHYFGIITFAFEIILPLIRHLIDYRKKYNSIKQSEKQPLRENEIRTDRIMEEIH